MSPRLRAGVVGGFLAGVVMLLLHLAGTAARFSPYAPLTVAARAFFPTRLALNPALGPWLGVLAYFVVSVFYAIVFVHIFGLRDDRNNVVPAILFALAVGLLDMGVIAPARGIVEPLWRMDAVAIGLELLRHLAWGGILGWIVNIYAELRGEETGTA